MHYSAANKVKIKSSSRIELLAPAGSITKAKVAISYGASAIYLAGKSFGLRSAASNFSLSELEDIVSYAHANDSKVYLVLNSFLYNEDINALIAYLKEIKYLAIDAVIVSDIGALSLVKKHTDFDIHVSTQASVSSIASLKFWKSLGAKRVVLAREVSVKEATAMKADCDIELEMFAHGSMCMSYSGKCVISNYTANRDANKGGCVQSCRWSYDIKEGVEDDSDFLLLDSYIMNSKDLNGLDFVHDMISGGIGSLKIEGRMKSYLYLAWVISVYKRIITYYYLEDEVSKEDKIEWNSFLEKTPNRGFTSAFLDDIEKASSVGYEKRESKPHSDFIGLVKEVHGDFVLIDVRNSFSLGDTLVFLLFTGDTFSFHVDVIFDISFSQIRKAPINSVVFLKNINHNIKAFNVISI